MKKLLVGLFVLVVFVFASSLQAEVRVRGIDRADEIKAMRAYLAEEGHTYTVGMNPAMNYSLDELCKLDPTLAGPDDIEHERNEEDLDLDRVMALPSAYTGYCSSIKNQGSCGSCWAFGIIGAIEGRWRKQLGTYYNFSEQHLLDCNSYGYSCSGGWFTAYNDVKYPKYFRWESCYPYVGYKGSCKSSCYADYVSSWYYVGSSSGVPTTSSIKQKIYDKGAVSVAVYANSTFQAYSGGCYTSNYSGSVNHAVVLYGWDDGQCGGIWRLKNSWGTRWGESGKMRIGYGKQKVGYAACYPNY
jgi:hypothetical protein